MISNNWILGRKATSAARIRLFCFPYAGAGANALGKWAQRLPPWIGVNLIELPGRWTRAAEPAITDMDRLVEAVGDGLDRELEPPYAFFGYSFGALLAFLYCRRIRNRSLPGPTALFAAARRAPHCPREHNVDLHTLPDETFIRELVDKYSGIPSAVLANPALLEVITPVMRADMKTLERYRYVDEPALDVPLFALGGLDDRTTPPDTIHAWSRHTTREFHSRLFPGDHFFIHQDINSLAEFVAIQLSRLLDQPMT